MNVDFYFRFPLMQMHRMNETAFGTRRIVAQKEEKC